jgi:hypothetical protein
MAVIEHARCCPRCCDFYWFDAEWDEADADGEVTEWCEIAGGKHVSREEAIKELEEQS